MKSKPWLVIIFLLISRASVHSFVNISPATLHTRLVQKDTLLLLDVREVSEYRRGHIAEPVGQLPLSPASMPYNSGVLTAEYTRLPHNIDILVYCASGGRSAAASSFLESKGFSRIFNMSGGFSSWTFESRKEGFGDHSGKWVYFNNPQATSLFSVSAFGDTSKIIFPASFLSGMDSVYVELHFAATQTPVPPTVPISDLLGLFRLTVLDRFGLSRLKGDTLSLAKPVQLVLRPHCLVDENTIANQKTALMVYVPGQGWQPRSYTFQNLQFLRSESVLYKWYNGSAYRTTRVENVTTQVPLNLIKAYPNPFNGMLTIVAPPGAELAIFNCRGGLVQGLTSNRWSPTPDLASGVYLVQIQHQGHCWWRKVTYMR